MKDAPTQPVLDEGRYRAALEAGQPVRREMFTRFEPDGVVWPDGSRTSVDAVIFATGYRPHLPYLAGTGALTEAGVPKHRAGYPPRTRVWGIWAWSGNAPRPRPPCVGWDGTRPGWPAA